MSYKNEKEKTSIFFENKVSFELVDYLLALDYMDDRVKKIQQGFSKGLIWFLEHPPLYTAGTSAKEQDLLLINKFPVHKVGRGGQYTYHGPGQMVIYCMIDLRLIGVDIREFVKILENWILRVLELFKVKGQLYSDRIGVWTTHPITQKESKIAAIGLRVSKGVVYHGVSLNITTNLEHYKGIVPCGISDFGVTSLSDIGIVCTFKDVLDAFLATCPVQFYDKDA